MIINREQRLLPHCNLPVLKGHYTATHGHIPHTHAGAHIHILQGNEIIVHQPILACTDSTTSEKNSLLVVIKVIIIIIGDKQLCVCVHVGLELSICMLIVTLTTIDTISFFLT